MMCDASVLKHANSNDKVRQQQCLKQWQDIPAECLAAAGMLYLFVSEHLQLFSKDVHAI